ncbi:MAG: hypothetical protein QW734_04625 [Candidatus Bathyarchaeia archaeon]
MSDIQVSDDRIFIDIKTVSKRKIEKDAEQLYNGVSRVIDEAKMHPMIVIYVLEMVKKQIIEKEFKRLFGT